MFDLLDVTKAPDSGEEEKIQTNSTMNAHLNEFALDEPPQPDNNIPIIDNWAEISCTGLGFSVIMCSSETITLGTAMAVQGFKIFDIVITAVVIIDHTSNIEILISINQATLFPGKEQHES
jgi:hypothetical protein